MRFVLIFFGFVVWFVGCSKSPPNLSTLLISEESHLSQSIRFNKDETTNQEYYNSDLIEINLGFIYNNGMILYPYFSPSGFGIGHGWKYGDRFLLSYFIQKEVNTEGLSVGLSNYYRIYQYTVIHHNIYRSSTYNSNRTKVFEADIYKATNETLVNEFGIDFSNNVGSVGIYARVFQREIPIQIGVNLNMSMDFNFFKTHNITFKELSP
jgi:hypothetical protein